MSNEIQSNQNINKLDSMIEKKGGLYDALEQSDKIILLDFSGSMSRAFDGKDLYQHLIDAVRGYEHEYIMIRFESTAKIIENLDDEKPDGFTDLTRALELARSKGAAEFIVVSDGLPDSPEKSLKYALDNRMKISTIFMGDNVRGKIYMQQLASMTGGKSDDIKLLKGFGGMLKRTVKGLIEG